MRKVVLITGASRGIGAATARTLAGQGYAICINYRTRADCAAQLCNELREKGGNAVTVQADVSSEAEVEQLFSEIDTQLGRLTHLVNNAGILRPQMRVEEMSAARINEILATNVTGYFLCCREAVKRMEPGSVIVNVSSVAARLGSPNEYVDYAASKGAVDTLTKGLALEVAEKGIRVNGVRPGYIYTDMQRDSGEPDRVDRLKHQIPLKRGGRAEEVAAAIGWLCSDESSYITGSILDIGGGR